MHSPEFKGNPSNVGSPNNKSHSLVYSDIDDLGVRVNLADYPRNNYEDSKCVIDQSAIDKDLEELRQRLNDTEYHKLWNFAN
ncbi:hypothetical protein JN11_04541 [Mucilaginibacter frigoritolerans]|uniref:Uncharacterized protein n=1 Tax=Mucilaginibacter frigoritolerans TaxID=652788 RepID=A0A562TPK9_9SPHI|nr:hypothetical protein JN11_04541 [Mucilaginibacter frigoritolerans]